MRKDVRRILTGFILVMGFLVARDVSGWDFSGKMLHSAVREIAERGKLNIIVPAEDRLITSFRVSPGLSPSAALRSLAEKTDCVASLRGDAFLLLPRSLYRKWEGMDMLFGHIQERPIEWAVAQASGSMPVDVSCVPYPEGNFCVLTGLPDDLRKAQTAWNSLDVSAKPLLVTLQLADARTGRTKLSLQFSAIDRVPTSIEFSAAPDRRHLTGYVTVTATDKGPFEIAGSLNANTTAAQWGSVSLPKAAGAGEFPDFCFQIGGEEWSGTWSVTEFPRSRRLSISSETIGIVAPVALPIKEPKAATEPFMRFSLSSVDAADVYQTITASAGGNLALHADCTGKVSLYCYGSELYFEEFLVLIAKGVHHSVRKVGNTWIIAPVGKISDAICTADFAVRRLQFADARRIGLFSRSLVKNLNMTGVTGVSHDIMTNSFIFGGSSEIFRILRPFTEKIDGPPWLLKWRVSSPFGSMASQETVQAPTGRSWQRLYSDTRAATTSVELLPVIFGSQGLIGVRYELSCVASAADLQVKGWSFLETATETCILNGAAPERLGIRLAASPVGPADFGMNPHKLMSDMDDASDGSEEEGENSASDRDEDAGKGGFDDAFDSIF
jgi:hypothetical protein